MLIHINRDYLQSRLLSRSPYRADRLIPLSISWNDRTSRSGSWVETGCLQTLFNICILGWIVLLFLKWCRSVCLNVSFVRCRSALQYEQGSVVTRLMLFHSRRGGVTSRLLWDDTWQRAVVMWSSTSNQPTIGAGTYACARMRATVRDMT